MVWTAPADPGRLNPEDAFGKWGLLPTTSVWQLYAGHAWDSIFNKHTRVADQSLSVCLFPDTGEAQSVDVR